MALETVTHTESPPPSSKAQIKSIDDATVHRICSGQVILDLATAVKELIENSIDAGATSVELRMRDHGSESVEVIDNGSGITQPDHATLAKKHYTSKIAQFEDIYRVRSFGFRGEALSSLCAFAKVVVVTSTHETMPAGTKLAYDARGNLASSTTVARAQGTTVTLSSLFHALPVRLHEFKRNLKREYAKCVGIVQAYALVSTGVRLSMANQVGKSERTRVLATHGNPTVKENIANVFGIKTVELLVPVDIDLDARADGEGEEGESGDEGSRELIGDTTGPTSQNSRNTADRQYIYVNGRPCDIPRVTKALNEVYGSFVTGKYPMAILDFKMETDRYDVNITPDKRTIMFENERTVVDTFKELLTRFLETFQGSYAMQALTRTNFETISKHLVDISSNLSTTTTLLNSPFGTTTPTLAAAYALRRATATSRKRLRVEAASLIIDDTAAVSELDRMIRKDDFRSMEVLGQFNLGFIVVRLRGDLFIVDQHASDEKFNYENLKRTMRVETQKLLRPFVLDLTAQQELVAAEHQDILRNNGFQIEFDPDAPASKRVKLLALPQIKKVSFTVKDLEELLHKLGDGGDEDARCARLDTIMASKACRTAVMIGTALDLGQMRKIVLQMGEMDQPWNCPHGRPTMRHLADLGAMAGDQYATQGSHGSFSQMSRI
ncbi:ATP-binding mismatch repair protein [Thoreauomyces humboldtii]|nr:ATP-binding mismatch repair protein [Thoreauomyces humboldtii]